jgi:hypothetical protein
MREPARPSSAFLLRNDSAHLRGFRAGVGDTLEIVPNQQSCAVLRGALRLLDRTRRSYAAASSEAAALTV